MSLDDRVRDTLTRLGDETPLGDDAWSVIASGRRERISRRRRRRAAVVTAAVVAVIAVVTVTWRAVDGPEAVTVADGPSETTAPAPAVTPLTTTVVGATADGRLVELDLRTPTDQTVLWSAPADIEISEITVDPATSEIYLGYRTSSDCRPKIGRFDRGTASLDEVTEGVAPTVVDGRVAFLEVGECADPGDPRSPVAVTGTIGLAGADGADTFFVLPSDRAEVITTPVLAWSPDGSEVAMPSGRSVVIVGGDPGDIRPIDTSAASAADDPDATESFTFDLFYRADRFWTVRTETGATGTSRVLTEWTIPDGFGGDYVEGTSETVPGLTVGAVDLSADGRYLLWTGTGDAAGIDREDHQLFVLDRETGTVRGAALFTAAFAHPGPDAVAPEPLDPTATTVPQS